MRFTPFVLLVSALALVGCQNQPTSLGADPVTTSSTQTSEASFKRTELLGKKWQSNKDNKEIGLAYAENLSALGQSDQQFEVLRALAKTHASDGPLLAKVGKQLLAANKGAEAIEMLEAAAALPGAEWQTYNALGSAYDQQGRYGVARERYQSALKLNPGEISVKNNLGMSYSLEGKLPEAEKMLREALNSPGGKNIPRVRQNLALVVGLQGRFDEARTIASEDLPPDQVEANLAYLQSMLSQQNTWQQLSDQPQEQPPG